MDIDNINMNGVCILMQFLIEELYDFYSVEQIVNNEFAPRVLEFDNVNNDPIRSKVSLELHLMVMKKYHTLFIVMKCLFPYVLKSQLVNMYKIVAKKSRAYGYQKVKELEEALLIGVEKYNGAEYVFLTYRSYNYLGVDRSKNPIERRPSESVLLRHFMRFELFLSFSEKEYNFQEFSYYRYFQQYKIENEFYNIESFFTTKEKESEFYYRIGEYFDIRLKDNYLSYRGYKFDELLTICSNPYELDLLSNEQQSRFLGAFLEKMLFFFSRRCSINLAYEESSNILIFDVKIICLPLTSIKTYQTLFSDINRLVSLLKCKFKKVALIYDFYVTDELEKSHFQEMVNPIFIKGDVVCNHKTVTSLDLTKRYQKQDSYESSKSKSRKL